MKRELLILCAIALIGVWTGCKPEPVEPDVEISPRDLPILEYNSTQDFTTNVPVNWSISHPNAGEVDLEGKPPSEKIC